MSLPSIGSRWREVETGKRAVVVTANREVAVMQRTDFLAISHIVSVKDGRPCGYEPVEEGEGNG